MNITLTLDFHIHGAPAQIEVDLDVRDANDWDVLKATLIHAISYVHQRNFLMPLPGPDFTIAPDLNVQLDPSEVSEEYELDICDALPAAIREHEQCAADAMREAEEMDFLEGRG